VPEPAWEPDGRHLESSNVARFMREHDVTEFDRLLARSVDDPDWFWDAVVRFLGIEFSTPYRSVLDTSGGIPWTRWFVGGRLNVASTCLDRWAADPARRDHPAVRWEGEDGRVRELLYGELRRITDAIASGLAARGIGEGDVVGLFLPLVPEAVAALLAVAKLGAIFLPLFSGYGADAIATRLVDAGAVALVTADGFTRRGSMVATKEIADAAADLVPSVHTVVVVPAAERDDVPANPERDVGLGELVVDAPFEARPVDSEHPLLLAYTSGTTGKPKGSVHVHGGFLAKIAEEVAFQMDVRPPGHEAGNGAGRDDVLFWVTDLGWIMGPWEIIGTLAQGATLMLYDGAPDVPGPELIWSLVERHEVTHLGVSPTLVRALMAHGDRPVRAHDRSSLRVLGSTGEPWNEAPWRWYFETVGERRCPVINISGGTEVGACFLSPHVVTPIAPCSLGGPSLGMAVDVFDDDGSPLRGAVGELVCTRPWPGMTRGLWRDPDRYLETYWSRWPDVWCHGDWASVGDDGQWFLHGRSDDTIKVAGKRLGPSEVETVLVGHPAVVEAAAVGLPDEVKGEALWCYVVAATGIETDEQLRAELAASVADALGRSFRPAGVRFVDAIPKTRSAKVMRRAIRAVATGTAPGDLSGLDNPAALDAIGAAR